MAEVAKDCIGLVEFNSIAVGIEAADAMLKVSEVELLVAKTVCPGKYICLVRGDVAAVQSSVRAGVDRGAETVVDEMVLPRVHPGVFPAINATSAVDEVEALGIIETFSVASSIQAADAAAKAAKVVLIEVRLAVGLGGKSFVTLTGEVAAARAAVQAGAAVVQPKGLLMRTVVIPAPKPELARSLL
ncbi:MAG: BMC domain-containing protein [candidate division KSB1 bacterium]|nr:BMC domain-containing protein [candidate division KSB1 bacterium]